MKITLTQQELTQLIQDHLNNQGICLNGKEVSYDFTDGVEITLGQTSKPKRKPKEVKPEVEAVEATTEDEVIQVTDPEEVETTTDTEEVETNEEDLPFKKTPRPLFT